MIQPVFINVHAIGQLEEFTHQGSLIFLDEEAEIKAIIPQLYKMLSSQKEIRVGITTAPLNGLIVRIMGQKAEQLFDCLKLIAGVLLQRNSLKPTTYAI